MVVFFMDWLEGLVQDKDWHESVVLKFYQGLSRYDIVPFGDVIGTCTVLFFGQRKRC